MQVKQYTFQSPSTSAVQVGRLDTSTQQNKSTESAPSTNETQKRAESFVATQTQEVKPTLSDTRTLDTYV